IVGVEDIERAGPAVAGLINLGYEYVPEFETELPDRRYFRLGSPETHHVHMVPLSSDYFAEHLLFRDGLRRPPRRDREASGAGKVPFIDTVVAAARRDAGAQSS